MITLKLDLESIISEIKELLQIENPKQQLDSLDIIVIRSYLKSLGIECQELLTQTETTIEGWKRCLRQFLENGLITSTK